MSNSQPKKILWLNWKDIQHPETGGAELIQHEICARLVAAGHQVTLLTSMYEGAAMKDEIDGYQVIRVGKAKSNHTFLARAYYKKHLKNQFDLIIEEVNTAPYLIATLTDTEQVVLYYNQLAREIWFYLLKFPLNLIGYLILEPVATLIQAFLQRWKNLEVLAISESTKQDIARFGFDKKRIHLFRMGIQNEPLQELSDSSPKEKQFTVLFHSSLRAMKQPLEVFKAFGDFQNKYPESQLWISGGGDQTELRNYAIEFNFLDKVTFYGRTPDAQKLDLMQRATVLCSTSIKEGWGLIVTEANSMGTPAIAYDVDGLRDAAAGDGNWVVGDNSKSLATKLEELWVIWSESPVEYQRLRDQAWENSKSINFDNCYSDFTRIVHVQ